MTAQTPAPKASGVAALLASLSSVPLPPQSSAKEDFLAVILQALTAQPGAKDQTTPEPTPTPAKEKLISPETPSPDATATGLLLALLAPPLPTLPKTPARKELVVPDQSVLSASPPTPAPEAAPAKPALAEKAPAPPPPVKQTNPTLRPLSGMDGVDAGDRVKQTNPTTPPPSGTPAANPIQRMTFSPERHEIAGRTEQKLPLVAVSAVSSPDTGGSSPDGGTKLPLPFSWHEAPPEPLAIMDISTKAGTPPVPLPEPGVDAPARAVSTSPLERLEQMISHEVATVRQMGAQSLGVALKLDSNTQLFLQLTTHNGVTQASVRLERGQFAPEDTHWAQLQQSLARQNVELLPMTAGANLNFQNPAEKRPRQFSSPEDWPTAGAAVPQAQSRKQKEQNRSRKNWESWA